MLSLENIKQIIVNCLQTGTAEEIKKDVDQYYSDLFNACWNDQSEKEKIALINEYCEENNFCTYEEANDQNIANCLENDALKVLDFLKSNNFNKYDDYLFFNGCGKLQTISKYKICSFYREDQYFINWLKDNEKLSNYEELKTTKKDLLKMVKEEAKNIFHFCTFELWQKEYNYILWKLRDPEIEKEPKKINGIITTRKNYFSQTIYENYFIFINDKVIRIAPNQIKKIIGFNSVLNNAYKLPPLATVDPVNGIFKRNNFQNELQFEKVGRYSYISDNRSGAGCDGELKSYYISILKLYEQVIFTKDNKIYSVKNNYIYEVKPEEAGQSEKTRSEIKKAFAILWQIIKDYNKNEKE